MEDYTRAESMFDLSSRICLSFIRVEGVWKKTVHLNPTKIGLSRLIEANVYLLCLRLT